MTGSPFTLYTHAGEKSLLDISVTVNDFIHSNLPLSACIGPGPNPVKAAIALEHLGLQYDTIPLGFGEGKDTVKDTNYTSQVNPNGRVPDLVDHGNKDFIVFVSGAILPYLAEKYDKSGKLGGSTPEERAIVNQWLAWQISGLDPSQGQLVWFLAFHEGAHGEQPSSSIIARYQNEVERLRSVETQPCFRSRGLRCSA